MLCSLFWGLVRNCWGSSRLCPGSPSLLIPHALPGNLSGDIASYRLWMKLFQRDSSRSRASEIKPSPEQFLADVSQAPQSQHAPNGRPCPSPSPGPTLLLDPPVPSSLYSPNWSGRTPPAMWWPGQELRNHPQRLPQFINKSCRSCPPSSSWTNPGLFSFLSIIQRTRVPQWSVSLCQPRPSLLKKNWNAKCLTPLLFSFLPHSTYLPWSWKEKCSGRLNLEGPRGIKMGGGCLCNLVY